MTKPISKYTFGESKNLKVYENYSSETITLTDADHSGAADGGITGTITGVTRLGTALTFTTSTDPHGLVAYDFITVSGTTNFNTANLATGRVESTSNSTSFVVTAASASGANESGLSATYVSQANTEESTNWVTNGNGVAKKITIIPKTGTSSDVIRLYLKVNGSYGNAIETKFDDYPLTIDNVMVDQIKLTSEDLKDSTEEFSIIAYH